MADAVLLVVMGLLLLLFGIQEFLDPQKRTVWSLVSRALTIMVIGLYLVYLYYEMGSGSGGSYGAGGGYAPIPPGY